MASRIRSTNTSSVNRDKSPLSPTRKSRVQEKEELQNLNSRLAAYIEKIRNSEQQVQIYRSQLETIEEKYREEKTSIKVLYQQEIDDLRLLLDEISRNKARLEIELGKTINLADDNAYKKEKSVKELDELNTMHNKILSEYDKTKSKLSSYMTSNTKLEEEIRLLKDENVKLVKSNQELSIKIEPLDNQVKRLNENVKKLKEELKDCYDQISVLKKKLEAQTLDRVDLENRLQTMKEDVSFKDSIYQEQFKEESFKHEILYKDLEPDLRNEYQNKLELAIDDLRNNHENMTNDLKNELQILYEKKITSLEENLSNSIKNAEKMQKENFALKNRFSCFESEQNENSMKFQAMQNDIDMLKKRNTRLSTQMAKDKEVHLSEMQKKENEVSDLQKTLSNYIDDYQELESAKIALSQELSIYSKLLSCEEERHNMSNDESTRKSCKRMRMSHSEAADQSSKFSPLRSLTTWFTAKANSTQNLSKKKTNEYHMFSSPASQIEVTECDVDGKFVKIANKGKHDLCVGGWRVTKSTDVHDSSSVTYKFRARATLKAGQVCTIWSSTETSMNHTPPVSIVMKRLSWPKGENFCVLVFNKDFNQVAQFGTKVEDKISNSKTSEMIISNKRLTPNSTKENHTNSDKESSLGDCAEADKSNSKECVIM